MKKKIFTLALAFMMCLGLVLPLSANAGSNPLIGAWSSGPNKPIERAYRWIEFKNDGTFTWRFQDETNTYMYGNIKHSYGYYTWSGKYSVSGDKIIVTNIYQKYTTNMKNDQSRADSLTGPVKNDEWKFYFSNKAGYGSWKGLTWLYIDFFPNHPTMKNKHEYFVKPIK